MENAKDPTLFINNLLIGSTPPLSMGQLMMSSSYGLSLLFFQSVQHHQSSGQLLLTSTAKSVIDILKEQKSNDAVIDKIIDSLRG